MSTLLSAAAKILLPIAIEAGADKLKELLGGDSTVAGGIVDQVAGRLGVPPEPRAIEQAYRDNPSEVIQAVQEVDEFHARLEEARAKTMQSQHRLQEKELSAGLLARIGRPLNTVLFAFECAALMMAVCLVVVRGIPANLDFNQVAPLLALVVPVLTAQAGVIGWDSRQQRLAGGKE